MHRAGGGCAGRLVGASRRRGLRARWFPPLVGAVGPCSAWARTPGTPIMPGPLHHSTGAVNAGHRAGSLPPVRLRPLPGRCCHPGPQPCAPHPAPGKTSVAHQFVEGKFVECYEPTVESSKLVGGRCLPRVGDEDVCPHLWAVPQSRVPGAEAPPGVWGRLFPGRGEQESGAAPLMWCRLHSLQQHGDGGQG